MSPVIPSPTGQNHDRLNVDDFPLIAMADDDARTAALPPDIDITSGQKMISAVTGSLMTSLLVTPLDVVRVRLQSQKAPTSNVNFSRLATQPRSLAPSQAAELGVTACCREVFFAGNNPEYCIAGPRIEGITSNMGEAGGAAAECAVEETQRKTYNSTLDGLRKIARNEGVTTLWRGLSPTLVMTIPANIIYFVGYDWLRNNPKSPFARMSDVYAPLTAGSLARILAATAVGPIELVRTRMQAAPGSGATNHLKNTFKGIKEDVAVRGWTTLWRGLTLTLWRDVPFSGLYWWGYETIRGKITDVREERRGRSSSRDKPHTERRRRSQSSEKHSETLIDSFAAGALSGAFASIVTTPFDVGKTRTQVFHETASRAASDPKGYSPPETRNMVRLLWHIFQTEGVTGLWRGWIPRTLKVAPACAIMISSYEVGKRAFKGVNERKMGEAAQRV